MPPPTRRKQKDTQNDPAPLRFSHAKTALSTPPADSHAANVSSELSSHGGLTTGNLAPFSGRRLAVDFRPVKGDSGVHDPGAHTENVR